MASVILDAGHGGSDPGAVYNGRQEKDDVLRLAMAVGKILEQNGIDVSYTRTSDIYETPFQKAMEANESGADYLVSIHRNSGTVQNTYNGVQTLVYNNSGSRKVLAENINNKLAAAGFKNLGLSERPNLVVLRRSKMPAVMVEVGFINNDNDNKIFDEEFDSIAQAIADGIIETVYLNSTKSVSSSNVKNNNLYNAEENQYTRESRLNLMNKVGKQSEYNGGAMRISENVDEDYDEITDVPTDDMDTPNTGRKFYRVQVGAYSNKENADRMLASLISEGFPAFMVYDDGLYRVQVGAYEFLPNAIRMENRLRKYRYDTYITV